VLSTESAQTIDHLAVLEVLTANFARALAVTPLDARPVSFRTWTLTDLAAHLGGVHQWAAEIVETGHRAERANRPELTMDPAAWYDQGRARLLGVLTDADP
jgi:Mycothiol maleylpyruvate isomerase N-terminal domain